MANQYQQPYQFDTQDDKLINDSSGNYEEPEKELLKIIISVKEMMSDFEHSALRGEYKIIDAIKGEVWQKAVENRKIINEIGVREIMARLSGIVNEKQPISYISEEDYYKKMLYFDFSISEMFAKRSEVWELDIEMAKPIKDAMIEIADAVLSMAIEGFTAVNFKTQYQKHDIQRSMGEHQEQGKSFLGIPLGKQR